MSDKSGQNDPSMNEILGSIKRIITEDSGQGGQPQAASQDEDEEILDLTDEVSDEEEDELRHEPRLATAPVEEPEAEVRREPILGLHRPADMAEPAVTEEPAAPASTEETVTAAPVAEPEPVQAGSAAAEPVSTPVVQPASEPVEAIVSETATAATASALGELTRVMDEKTSKLKVGAGDASISDIVKEMLRPMLREWLDENLPVIVERVVRREIQKLVDRAEVDD